VTIVPLARVTLLGLLTEKERVLGELQELGCLHLVPLAPGDDAAIAEGPSPDARNALRFLLACRQRRRQVRDPARFDADAVEAEALDLQERMRALEDERDALLRRIETVRPWGEFTLPEGAEFHGLRLWFYVVPHYRMAEVEALAPIRQVVRRDNRFCYVVVMTERPPEAMPVLPEELGERPLSTLERRLDEVLIELEELEARRVALTRWCALFARNLARLEDRAALAHAALHTRDAEPLFAVQGWIPGARTNELEAYAGTRRLALVVEAPTEKDAPPTLMHNPEPVAAGEDLVNFYSTPGYWNWDPSAAVFVSFVVFFAMILSDAGYALLWGLIVALFWRRMERTGTGRRLRRLFAVMGAAAFVWGGLVGSFFGVRAPESSLLAGVAVVDLDDHTLMMRLTILIGAVHVVAGNLGRALSLRGRPQAMAPLGWCAMVTGGTVLWLASEAGAGLAMVLAPWVMAAGALLVLGFTSAEPALWRRLLGGVLALTRVTGAFGDVLSYLRLFALGLASASLALVFNELAADVARAVPGIGLFLAILVVILGHAMNFALAVVGGFVHGLRLNFIELFNWGLEGEGTPFRPFAKREGERWTRS